MAYSQLPKSGAELGRLLSLLETDHSLKEATKMVKTEVKNVWMYHIGQKLVMGKHYCKDDDDIVNANLKMFKHGQHVTGKVVELHKKWKSLERGSRSPDRAMKICCLNK